MTVSIAKGQESVESFLSGKMSRVDVAAIQTELRRLWLEAATTHDESEQPQVSRACSCNLVLFTDREDAQTSQSALLDAIVLRHPARSILTIMHQDASEKRLEGWVSARCHMTQGAKQICSEQITIVAEKADEEELISVIDSLVLGDQPTFLWWTLPDITGDRIGPYLACVRRAVVDSGLAPYSFHFLSNLHNIVESVGECLGVSDLNWARLVGLRRALSEEFERAPFSVADIDNIKSVKVWTNGQELQADDCSIQALLLVGWLAGRLGWLPVYLGRETESSSSCARFERKKGAVEVEFKSMPFTNVIPGAVFQIVVELDDGRAIEISRDPAIELQNLLVTVREGDRKVRELIADDASSDVVVLMSDELDELGPDMVFAESLKLAFDLIQLVCVPE